MISKQYIVHKSLERLLKADCLNMTEVEIEVALKSLRDSYGIEGFTLEVPVAQTKLRAEDITMQLFNTACYEFNNLTKIPYIGVGKT